MLHIYVILGSFLLILLIFLNRSKIMQKDEKLQKAFERKKRREELAKIAKEDIAENKTFVEEKTETIQQREEVNLSQITSFIKRAETLLAKDNIQEAEKLLIQVLSIDQDNFVANSMLALIYLKTQSDSKAEVIYRKLLEMKPRDPALYTNLGLAFYNQAKYPESLESYSFAAKLDPNKPGRHINVGQVCFVLRMFDEAIIYFKEAIRLSPRNVDYLFMLADTYREKGDLKEAKETYNKVLNFEPYNNEAQEEVRRLKAMGY